MGKPKLLSVKDGSNWKLQNIRKGRPLLSSHAEEFARMLINQQKDQNHQAEDAAARAG